MKHAPLTYTDMSIHISWNVSILTICKNQYIWTKTRTNIRTLIVITIIKYEQLWTEISARHKKASVIILFHWQTCVRLFTHTYMHLLLYPYVFISSYFFEYISFKVLNCTEWPITNINFSSQFVDLLSSLTAEVLQNFSCVCMFSDILHNQNNKLVITYC